MHKTKRVPRPYQLEAQAGIEHDLFEQGYESTVLSLPPAGGKTFTTVDYAKSRFLDKGGRVIWVCHTKELIVQAARDFMAMCPGVRVTIWKGAEFRDATGQVLVTSNQSYRSLLRHLAQNPDLNDFELMVIDECHHAAGKTYQQLVSEVNWKKVLGLSGTPVRHDEQSTGFPHIAYQKTFRQLYSEGWCARPIYYRYRTGQKHLFDVKRGDYTSASLASLNNAPRNELIAREFLSEPKFWPGIAFCTGVDHVKAVAKAVREEAKRRNIRCRVEYVIGDQSREGKERRDRIVRDYLDGKVDLLVNCEVFTEGTDLPNIRSVLMTRPTASHVKYLQMLLRGGRSFPEHSATGNDPSPGLHPDNVFYVLDFVDSAHHYVNASRGWALKELDVDQVKGELRKTDDLEKKRELVEQAGKEAWDLFEKEAKAGKAKQWRGVKYEDEVLSREEWTLCQASAVLITVDTWAKDEKGDPTEKTEKRLLTGDQDFAVLIATEWLSRELGGRFQRSTTLERKQAIQAAFRMFGSECFKVQDWTTIMNRFLSHRIFKQKTKEGEPIWTHIVSDGDPPMQEVSDILAEREREARELDGLIEDLPNFWEEILEKIERRHPSPGWRKLNADVDPKSLRWANKTLTFRYERGAFVRQAYWLEAAAEVVLRLLLDLDDARVFMELPTETGRQCPECEGGKMVVRYPAHGGKFLSCSRYPDCESSLNLPSKREALRDLKRAMDPVRPPGR